MWYSLKNKKPTEHPVLVNVDDQGKFRGVRFPEHPGLSTRSLLTIYETTFWSAHSSRCSCVLLLRRLSLKRKGGLPWYEGFDMPAHLCDVIQVRDSARIYHKDEPAAEYALGMLDLYGGSVTFHKGTGRIHPHDSKRSYDFSLSLYGLCIRALRRGIRMGGEHSWDGVFPYRLVNDRLYAYIVQNDTEGKLVIVRRQIPSPLREIRERMRREANR